MTNNNTDQQPFFKSLVLSRIISFLLPHFSLGMTRKYIAFSISAVLSFAGIWFYHNSTEEFCMPGFFLLFIPCIISAYSIEDKNKSKKHGYNYILGITGLAITALSFMQLFEDEYSKLFVLAIIIPFGIGLLIQDLRDTKHSD